MFLTVMVLYFYFQPCLLEKTANFIGKERFYIYQYSPTRQWVLAAALLVAIIILSYLSYSFLTNFSN